MTAPRNTIGAKYRAFLECLSFEERNEFGKWIELVWLADKEKRPEVTGYTPEDVNKYWTVHSYLSLLEGGKAFIESDIVTHVTELIMEVFKVDETIEPEPMNEG